MTNSNKYKYTVISGIVVFLLCVLFPWLSLKTSNSDDFQIQGNLVAITSEQATSSYEKAKDAAVVSETGNQTLPITQGKNLSPDRTVQKQNIYQTIKGSLVYCALLVLLGVIGWYRKSHRQLVPATK